MKVRLSDVLTVANLRSRAGRKIAQKHLDFVLVTPKRMRIVAAVELNDTSHQQPHRIERDQFVMQSLWTAGIPLIVRSIEQRYDSQEIRRHLNNAIRKAQRGETILNGTNDLP